MRRLGFNRQALSVFVAIALIAGCSGGDTKTSNGVSTDSATSEPASADSTSGSVPTTTAASLPPVDVPQPPTPAAVTGTTPQEQALGLSESVSTATDPIGGWLAAYDSMGIPVVGAGGAGIGTTGDDPIGPTFAAVWMQSDAALKSSGLPLSDIVRMYVDENSQSAGANMLAHQRVLGVHRHVADILGFGVARHLEHVRVVGICVPQQAVPIRWWPCSETSLPNGLATPVPETIRSIRQQRPMLYTSTSPPHN